ncbi:hypothetical protein RJ639_000977 [Escallonia herrerae]|uniref:Uncharacterized protein n=1 Tax=Escallonia herrerae TaxID=1293975 RepID=A0AA88XIG1_9ASTE|nr:hypothetical protein RJ639_000977 [Escallonia herrerae]
MSKSVFRDGYKKVASLLKKTDPKKMEKFPILEGHPAAKHNAETAIESHEELKENIKALKKEFRIYRWNPDHPDNKPYLQSYFLDLSTCGPKVSPE